MGQKVCLDVLPGMSEAIHHKPSARNHFVSWDGHAMLPGFVSHLGLMLQETAVAHSALKQLLVGPWTFLAVFEGGTVEHADSWLNHCR